MGTGDNYLPFVPEEEKLTMNESTEQQEKELTLEEVRARLSPEIFEVHLEKTRERITREASIERSIVRLDQEKKIQDTLLAGQNVAIRGLKRIGKSSMLNSLVNDFGADNSIKFDAIPILSDSSLDYFKKRFGLYEVCKFIRQKEIEQGKQASIEEIREKITESGQTPFEYLNQYLKDNNIKCFIAIDEVVNVIDNEGFLRYIASLGNLDELQIALVLHFVDIENNKMLQKIFGEDYQEFYIRPLTLEETRLLVEKDLEGSYLTFAPDAIEKIYEFTGGKAREINYFVNEFLAEFCSVDVKKLNYTASDMEDVIERIERNFDNIFNHYRQVFQKTFNDEERDVLKKIMQGKKLPFALSNEGIMQNLLDTMWVTKDEENQVYRLNGQVLEMFFQKYPNLLK
ncbi:MAG: hypothetical protein PHQ18_00155 [Patescibacteria group bacterium]|nr:hypothetical protein [Patescibacteria group bacterium]